ncbi:MAG: hypothetical protein OCD76_19070 [Reichenbachiella sp.]
MSDRISLVPYKDIKVLYTDLSGLPMEDAISVLEETLILVPKYPERSVYSLLNVKGMRFGTDVMKTFNKVGKNNGPYVKATAVCGLTSMTRLLAKGVVSASKRKADFFNEPEESKEWLYQVSIGNK